MSINTDASYVADWVDPHAMHIDPYPTYAKLRAVAPVAWVPALGRFLITGFDECFQAELDAETFSSHEDDTKSTSVRATGGRSLIRKDDPEHKRERGAVGPALRPLTIKKVWTKRFEQNAERYLAELKEIGPGADIVQDFAVPFAAANLAAVAGLEGVDALDVARWSHRMIGGIGNVLDDPEIWKQTEAVHEEIYAAIENNIQRVKDEPDASMLSAMVHAPHPVPLETIRANLCISIAGGMNEPAHVISSVVWSLSQHSDQLVEVLDGKWSWLDVFEETARWQSPIAMYPRRVAKDTVYGGVPMPAGSTVGLVVGAANRDERRFENAEAFDVRRPRITNLAFGNGEHICLGNWVARAEVAQVALPRLYREFPGLRCVDPDAVQFRGWVIRGPLSMPVTWDAP